MTFSFSVPGPGADTNISFEPASSVIFVGANGSGKTRLAVHIEEKLGAGAHRIAAHRALSLKPDLPKISEALALNGLHLGHAAADAKIHHRNHSRWKDRHATELLNDYDFLMQALIAEQTNCALEWQRRARSGDSSAPPLTKFEKLKKIWERLLPGREIVLESDNVEVELSGGIRYSASQMSDGERAAFYILGQALLVAAGSVLVVDEPELHMHPSIMAALWDEIEAARMDCGFVFITHDLEFAASRTAQKFVMRAYAPAPSWTLEPIPANSGFPEEVVTLILGSRRPVLFVESGDSGLDPALYRACYPEWTVIPRGSCEEVIHSVVTMRRNDVFTRVTCCGIVDADDRDANESEALSALGVGILPVSEIENLILLPSVSEQIAISEGYTGEELAGKLDALRTAVFKTLESPAAVEEVVVRYCKRRIDRRLKRIELKDALTIEQVRVAYSEKTEALDIVAIAAAAKRRIDDAIASCDLSALLTHYDNKGLLAVASSHLKASRMSAFEEWLIRALNSGTKPGIVAALRAVLPSIEAR